MKRRGSSSAAVTHQCRRNGGGRIGSSFLEGSLVKSRCPSPCRCTEESVLELGGPPPPAWKAGRAEPWVSRQYDQGVVCWDRLAAVRSGGKVLSNREGVVSKESRTCRDSNMQRRTCLGSAGSRRDDCFPSVFVLCFLLLSRLSAVTVEVNEGCLARRAEAVYSKLLRPGSRRHHCHHRAEQGLGQQGRGGSGVLMGAAGLGKLDGRRDPGATVMAGARLVFSGWSSVGSEDKDRGSHGLLIKLGHWGVCHRAIVGLPGLSLEMEV